MKAERIFRKRREVQMEEDEKRKTSTMAGEETNWSI